MSDSWSIASAFARAAARRCDTELGFRVNRCAETSTTTTTLLIPGVASAVAIVAESSAFDHLGTLQYRVNEYVSEADRATAVIASTSGALHSFVFLGAADLPRLVTRTAIPIAGEVPDPDNSTTEVAITCAATFTDDAVDPTFQYQYNVVTLGQNPAGCEQSAGAGDKALRDVAGVTFPATEYPLLTNASTFSIPQTSTREGPIAFRSIIQALIAERAGQGASGDRTSFVPGDDWAPIRFRYQAFIPESKIWAPGSTGSFYRPWQFFGGDNRSLDPNGSYRYRQDATVYFGSAHNIVYSEWMGQSHKYACRWPNASDCVLQQSGYASVANLSLRAATHSGSSRFVVKRVRCLV